MELWEQDRNGAAVARRYGARLAMPVRLLSPLVLGTEWTFATGNLTASQYLSSFLAIMPILKKFSVSTQKYRKDIKILICFESEGKPRDYGSTVRSLAVPARIFSLLVLFIMYVVSLLITMPGVCIRKTR